MSLANPTMDVLFEVLSGEDGCADHFPDKCCTLCSGWKHLIEHGYLSRGPEELARFKAAFHAQKKVPSGWDAQVEADGAERYGAVNFVEGGELVHGAERSEVMNLDFVHDKEKAIDIVEQAMGRERELLERLK